MCYFDLVAMVTIQGIRLAKNCNKRNSKTKGRMTLKIGIDVNRPDAGKVYSAEKKQKV